MKFSEIPYARPDVEALKADLTELTARLASAPDYEAAKRAFLVVMEGGEADYPYALDFMLAVVGDYYGLAFGGLDIVVIEMIVAHRYGVAGDLADLVAGLGTAGIREDGYAVLICEQET